MSKSLIKADLFRREPFADAVSFWPIADTGRDGPVPPMTRMIVDDGSVRICQFQPRPELEAVTRVSDLLEHLARPVLTALATHDRVHVYVVIFDKRALVPSAKAATQQKRQQAMLGTATSVHSSAIDDDDDNGDGDGTEVSCGPYDDNVAMRRWPWTQASGGPVVAAANDILPPWDIIRHRKGARERLVADIGPLLAAYIADRLARVVSAADKTVYIDGALMRSDCDQGRLYWANARGETGALPGAGNTLGEADLAAQWWATWPPSVFPASERGDVLLRTTDTDYLPISLAAATTTTRLHVCFGTPVWVRHQDTASAREAVASAAALMSSEHEVFAAAPPTPVMVCTKTTPSAVQCRELYDISRLRAIVHELHNPNVGGGEEVSMAVATASMLTLCALLGNDYVTRMPGMSHGMAWLVYEQQVLDKPASIADMRRRTVRPLVTHWTAQPPEQGVRGQHAPVPLPRRLASFVRALYHWQLRGGTKTRAGDKRPRLGTQNNGIVRLLPERAADATWRHVHEAAASKRPEQRPPTAEALMLLWERVWWTVAYMHITERGTSDMLPVALLGCWHA